MLSIRVGFIDVAYFENKIASYACELEARISIVDGGCFTVMSIKLWTKESKMVVWMNTK